jgi:photosystem II stability/assembly factor-like uncharacterized protein
MNRQTSTAAAAPHKVSTARGKRAMLAMLAVAAIVVPVSAWLGQRDSGGSAANGPTVGGDLHVVAAFDGRLFVSGHNGAGYLDTPGGWTQIASLDDKDGMGWAKTPQALLVGGHAGLYSSTDGGLSFSKAGADLPVTDVHALGSNGDTVYLASPQAGLFVSEDGGKTFAKRNEVGASFMGTITVDPADPAHAVAPDMQNGAVVTTDGGATWKKLGGPGGTMAVAWNPVDLAQIVVIGMDGAAISTDAGKSWSAFSVPDGTSAAAYDAGGQLYAAVLQGSRAHVFKLSGKTWTALK